jgi:hypothetical protein
LVTQSSKPNNQQSTINNQQSTINNQQSTINNQQSTINNQQSTINNHRLALESWLVVRIPLEYLGGACSVWSASGIEGVLATSLAQILTAAHWCTQVDAPRGVLSRGLNGAEPCGLVNRRWFVCAGARPKNPSQWQTLVWSPNARTLTRDRVKHRMCFLEVSPGGTISRP